MQQGRFIFPIQAVSHRSEWCSDWLKGKRNNNCCDRAYIFVMLCRLSLTSWPHFFQDELIVSLNSQHKCQWRIQQSRFASVSRPPGRCGSAWQEDGRELAAASLGALLLGGSLVARGSTRRTGFRRRLRHLPWAFSAGEAAF